MALEAVEEEGGTRRRARRRRRSRRARRTRGVTFAQILPSLLTTGNLGAGFYAIVKAASGNPLVASYAIFVAVIFDILDGRAARFAKAESKFGAEYDSIADTVSFGVAPAVIAFFAGHFLELRWAGWLMAFVYTACASLRLARFSVTSGRYRGRFDGLPSPAAAGMVISTVWCHGFLTQAGIEIRVPAILPALGVAAVGLLMVSPVPYRSFKDVHFGDGYRTLVVLVVGIIIIALEPGLNFFLLGLCYCLSGPVEWLWRLRTGTALEEVAGAVVEGAGLDDGPPPDPSGPREG